MKSKIDEAKSQKILSEMADIQNRYSPYDKASTEAKPIGMGSQQMKKARALVNKLIESGFVMKASAVSGDPFISTIRFEDPEQAEQFSDCVASVINYREDVVAAEDFERIEDERRFEREKTLRSQG